MIARRLLVAMIVLCVAGGLVALLCGRCLAPGGWTVAKLAMLIGLLGTAPWTGLCVAGRMV